MPHMTRPLVRRRTLLLADRDIRRAANLLISEHGTDAQIVASKMMDRCDRDRQQVWLRMRRAIAELLAAPAGKPN
jgi:hypothetical protein